jgi:hypothetical protein
MYITTRSRTTKILFESCNLRNRKSGVGEECIPDQVEQQSALPFRGRPRPHSCALDRRILCDRNNSAALVSSWSSRQECGLSRPQGPPPRPPCLPCQTLDLLDVCVPTTPVARCESIVATEKKDRVYVVVVYRILEVKSDVNRWLGN